GAHPLEAGSTADERRHTEHDPAAPCEAGGEVRLVALILASLIALSGSAFAVDPDEMLKDPAQEKRAEAIGKQLRCPVCKTESIEESDADFTRDLRKVVRERVAAGDSDQQ